MGDRTRRWMLPAVMVLLATVITAGLVTAPPRARDRADALAVRLRCPVCQGESVADSPSDTAAAIRTQIEDMVNEGRSDAEVLDYYVARYGRWVLLDPPAAGDTLLLWVLPAVTVVAGVVVIATRRRRDGPPAPLTDEQRAKLRRLTAALRRQEDAR